MKKTISSEYQELAKETRDWIKLASDSIKGLDNLFQRDQDSLGTDV